MNKKLIFGAAVVIAVVCGLWMMCGSSKHDIPHTIAVGGECLTTVPKDKTAITLRVTTLDKSAAVSMKNASTKMAEITETLKKYDIQMQTTQFDSYEKTQWNHETQKSESLGIETNIAVEVSAPSIDIIENILSQFAGQENVYSENLRMFTSPDTMKSAMEDCLGRAVENARVRANALAAGDGKRAGKMLSVEYSSSGSNIARPTYGLLRNAKVAATQDASAYSAGGLVAQDTQLTVNVSAVFEIK